MSKVEKDPDILSALLNVENLEEVRINQALYKENARNTGNKRLSEIDDRQKEIRSQLEELDSGKRYEKIRSKANKIRDEHRALQKEKEEINIPDQPEVNTEDDRLRNADVFLAQLTSLLDL